jgi:hypothetical protein
VKRGNHNLDLVANDLKRLPIESQHHWNTTLLSYSRSHQRDYGAIEDDPDLSDPTPIVRSVRLSK